MKVRIGFVSNSSSSSFIVYGVEADMNDPSVISALKELEMFADGVTDEQIEAAIEEGCTWEFSELLKSVDARHVEYYGNYIGVETDPTGLSVEDCVKGWVSKEDADKLDQFAAKIGGNVTTIGDVEYG